MPHLTVGGSAELHYRIDGTGSPALLLFNGATLPLEFWGPVAERLSQQHRVIRFDPRNAGATRAEGRFTLNDVAADAAALLDRAEVESAVAVGHAWGGRAAQVFARDYPHRVTGLVLCGTGGQLPAEDNGELTEKLREAMRADDRKAWEEAIELLFCAPGFSERSPDIFEDLCDSIWQHRPPRGVRWDPRVSPSPSYWGTCRAPALLIYGRLDRNGTPANAEDLHASLPDSKLIFVEDAGHFAIREAEPLVVDEILHFVAELQA